MPIITLQRRIREAGRIRGGDRKQGNRAGAKLLTPRFSSPDQAVVEAAAQHFGGTVREWDNGGRQEWDVVIKQAVIDVIVPPTGLAFSQWMELWSGGGCERRCDGQREILADTPCVCDPEAPECMPTTRLSLIVPDLETFGLFRLESHGWNAAQELSGTAELAAAMAERGQYLPATLHFEPRERRQPGKPIKKFTVPVLDLKVPMRRFMEVVSAQVGAPALAAGPAAVDAPRGLTPVGELPAAPVDSIEEQVRGAGREKQQRRGGAEPIRPTGRRPRAAREVGEPEGRGPSLGSPPSSPGGEPTGVARTASGDGDGVDGQSAAASPPGDRTATARAKHVAMRCRDVGIDTDDARHAFLALITNGRVRSGKDLTDAEFALTTTALDRLKAGTVRLVTGVDGTFRLDESTPPDVGAEGDDEAWWDKPRWMQHAKAHGLTQAKCMRAVKAICGELEVPVPSDLGEWSDGRISAQLREWIEAQGAEA